MSVDAALQKKNVYKEHELWTKYDIYKLWLNFIIK